MKSAQVFPLHPHRFPSSTGLVSVAVAVAFCLAPLCALAQTASSSSADTTAPVAAQAVTSPNTKDATPPTPGDNIRYGYTIHQMLELGGQIADHSGSSAVYDTMINVQTGPRILAQSLDMHAGPARHSILFDTLVTNSFGYGGSPNTVSFLNISKGKVYDFSGSFHRNRQYFDYNLLDNTLIPPESVPFVPQLSSPHLFNTVRRMTDLNLTLAPLSPISVRFGFNRNISQGPSYSSTHFGTEALLFQNWRNLSDSYSGGIDWKPFAKTSISFDEFVTQYKGDTSWQLAGLNYKLADGTPVSLGLEISSVWKTPCAAPFTPTGEVTPTCNAYLSYDRTAPIRTLFPTEQLRFQTTAIPRFTMNGRLLYTGTTSNMNNYSELFNGLQSRTSLRQSLVTGSSRARRVNVNGDLSLAWQVSPSILATNVFNFWNFRVPGSNTFTETDYTGKSLLAPPGATTITTTTDSQALNQKTKTNTFIVAWDVSSRARVSLGYRYRSRIITNGDDDFIPIHENWGLFGTALRPTPNWRINFDADAMYADKSFTRISPRQMQHYRFRTTYKPHPWLTFAGTVNIRESRNNVATVNHLEHFRDFSLGTVIAPGERWSLDVNYGYDSVYSSTILCYASTPPPPTAVPAPAVCVAEGSLYASNGYYNAPTQYGSLGFMWVPVKKVHLDGGYRMSAVNGNSDMINIRQVNGSLQSQYQSPYGNVVVDLLPNWKWKANYNYYSYGEGSPIGPTAPRSFRGNVYTLAVNYAF